MIDHVSSSDKYLVTTSSPGYSPYINNSQPMTGMLRYYNSNLEVYDGSNWQRIAGGGTQINLSAIAREILEWGEKKMALERKALALAEKHPAVRDALDAIALAEEKLKVIMILTEEESKDA